MRYYDVKDLSELPELPKEFRYFDFIGGSKELRCFVAPKDMPRSKFIEVNEALLDECLRPIYKNCGICVKQDASFALPGFYIVSPLEHYRSLDEIDQVMYLRLFFIIREIRKGMRETLAIQRVHIYYEEKMSKSSNVHYWILPIEEPDIQQRALSITTATRSSLIYDLQVRNYLNQFMYSEQKGKILKLI